MNEFITGRGVAGADEETEGGCVDMKQVTVFKDHKGKTSSSRVVTIFAVGVFMVVWAAVSLHEWKLQPLNFGDAAFIGMIVAGKYAGQFMEGRKNGNTQGLPGHD